jgi:TM2 domain-containing membrane protein YozV
MLSLQNPLKLVRFLGGVSVVGFLIGWFKTTKHRFGLDKFGQGTLLGVYRWLILSMTVPILDFRFWILD